MIRQLVKRLGLDRVEDYITEEMRRVKLEVLQEERRVVASLLARIEKRLAGLGGGAPRGRKRRAAAKKAAAPKRRADKKGVMRARGPGESLSDYILKAAKAGKPMKASDLVTRVKELGYKTVAESGNLLTSIYKVLGNNAVYHRVKAGVYELKKRAAAAAGQGKE